jgi:hypothetical protein
LVFSATHENRLFVNHSHVIGREISGSKSKVAASFCQRHPLLSQVVRNWLNGESAPFFHLGPAPFPIGRKGSKQ